jgi:hypothetical protein
MNKPIFATTKTFIPAPEPPAHVHDATCWQTNNPACVKWRVTILEAENRDLYGYKHHSLAMMAAMQQVIRDLKGKLDKMDESLARELKK